MKKVLVDVKFLLSDIDKIILVGGFIRILVVVEVVKNFIGKEFFKGVNLDECVVVGVVI